MQWGKPPPAASAMVEQCVILACLRQALPESAGRFAVAGPRAGGRLRACACNTVLFRKRKNMHAKQRRGRQTHSPNIHPYIKCNMQQIAQEGAWPGTMNIHPPALCHAPLIRPHARYEETKRRRRRAVCLPLLGLNALNGCNDPSNKPRSVQETFAAPTVRPGH